MKNTGTCTAIRRNRILSFIPFRSREYQEWLDKTIEDLDEYAENIFCNAVNLAMQGCWKKKHEEREQGSVFSVSETELHRAADPLVAELARAYAKLQESIQQLAEYSNGYKSEYR
ncbi:hypothetical protein [Marispirochaeta sp.]|uniref:hypothetical protein n=1 Tax=Marispirochaeta sp. TaxID=2038653 RepID=UPI0029C7174C|nr:hypothetical protein [Marispirochaeta sp.]